MTLNKLEVRRRAQPDPDARVCMYNLLFLVFFEKRKKEIQFSFKEFQQEKNEVQSKFIIIPRHRNRGWHIHTHTHTQRKTQSAAHRRSSPVDSFIACSRRFFLLVAPRSLKIHGSYVWFCVGRLIPHLIDFIRYANPFFNLGRTQRLDYWLRLLSGTFEATVCIVQPGPDRLQFESARWLAALIKWKMSKVARCAVRVPDLGRSGQVYRRKKVKFAWSMLWSTLF